MANILSLEEIHKYGPRRSLDRVGYGPEGKLMWIDEMNKLAGMKLDKIQHEALLTKGEIIIDTFFIQPWMVTPSKDGDKKAT